MVLKESQPSRVQELWLRARCGVVRQIIDDRITFIESSLEKKKRKKSSLTKKTYYVYYLQWRKGYNLYVGGYYKEAIEILQEVVDEMEKHEIDHFSHFDQMEGCGVEDNFKNNFRTLSFIHQTIGRCFLQLYLADKSEELFMEGALINLNKAVEELPFELATMLTLPRVLIELGTAYEHQCSYELAMGAYTQVLKKFPYFEGYFIAMYRTAVIYIHMMETMTDFGMKQQTHSKCFDILQFLMEGLPESIPELHAILLYARIFERHDSQAMKVRAAGIYNSLYAACRLAKIAGAHTPEYRQCDVWLANPDVYLQLGDEIMASGEALVAKEAYNKFQHEKSRKKAYSRDVSAGKINCAEFCQIAKCHAGYRNYPLAIATAEKAWKIDGFHRETRALLIQYDSKKHITLFDKEVYAVQLITSIWRSRIWRPVTIKRLKALAIKDAETAVGEDRYSYKAREQLAYYARDRWRPMFLFETKSATMIQRKFRVKRLQWVAAEALQVAYLKRVEKVLIDYYQYPFVQAVRREVGVLYRHKQAKYVRMMSAMLQDRPRSRHYLFSAKAQPILSLITAQHVVELQDKAACCLAKSGRAFVRRQSIAWLVSETRARKENVVRLAARTITKLFRGILEAKKAGRLSAILTHYNAAATTIQEFVRWRNTTFQHSVTRIVARVQKIRVSKARCLKILQRKWYPQVLKYVLLKNFRSFLGDERSKAKAEKERREALRRKMLRAARKIQENFRTYLIKRKYNIYNQSMSKRKSPQAMLSAGARALLNTAFQALVTHGIECQYNVPGINQRSAAFQQLLKQSVVVCGSEERTRRGGLMLPGMDAGTQIAYLIEQKQQAERTPFLAADCLMLSMALRNPYCSIHTIILQRLPEGVNPCYEFDLLAALKQCRSINSVHLLGGRFTESFITQLIEVTQVHNPRIVELGIENASGGDMTEVAKQLVGSLTASVGRLLCDYFNYSIPGIRVLSLHQCSIGDDDLTLITDGLAVNNSLRSLYLSRNMITDRGCAILLHSILLNKKRKLQLLDLNHNLIRCDPDLRSCIAGFEPSFKKDSRSARESCLQLRVLHNLVDTEAVKLFPNEILRVTYIEEVATTVASRDAVAQSMDSSLTLTHPSMPIAKNKYKLNRYSSKGSDLKEGVEDEDGDKSEGNSGRYSGRRVEGDVLSLKAPLLASQSSQMQTLSPLHEGPPGRRRDRGKGKGGHSVTLSVGGALPSKQKRATGAMESVVPLSNPQLRTSASSSR